MIRKTNLSSKIGKFNDKQFEEPIEYNPDWRGFNGYLLHVPREKLFMERSPDTVLVGLHPIKYQEEEPGQRFAKHRIYRDRVEQEWGDHGLVVITDNAAELYDMSARRRPKLDRRWDRFFTDTGLDMWEITGETRWENVVINSDRIPATWYAYFQQLTHAAYKAFHRHDIRTTDPVAKRLGRLTEDNPCAMDRPTGLKSRVLYRHLMQCFGSQLTRDVLEAAELMTAAIKPIAAYGRFRLADDPSLDPSDISF
jgi:hypothetical protein